MRSTIRQVRRLFQALARGDGLGRAAMRAGLHRDTARAYRDSGQLPGPTPPRTWRTRPDPFDGVWLDLEARLVAAPALEARTLLMELVAREPERFHAGQLRTL